VIFAGDTKAYVTSQRDREIVVLNLQNDMPQVSGRIKLKGQPNKMILNAASSRLFVAVDNTDTVAIVDTAQDRLIDEVGVTAPAAIFRNAKMLKGANPNGLALSPDERTLFVTNGGTSTVAVVQLGRGGMRGEGASSDHDVDEDESAELGRRRARVVGLIPTGWYPNDVAVSADGRMLYVVNGKSTPGPNTGACRDTLSIASGSLGPCNSRNQYVWQLEKAGFLAVPVPNAAELARATWQAAYNNNFPAVKQHNDNEAMMAFLRSRIRHVIYVVKENRTYDQVLGALERGNGDPSLAILAPYSPNHLQLARQFVTLDNFYDSGETSNTGWNWTTAARATDFTEKTSPVNYAGRGLTYDWEGNNRNINVGYATVQERQAAQPTTPADPDLLPGTADVAAPDSAGEAGEGYLWDAALRARLTVRNYGFYGDGARYSPAHSDFVAMAREPYQEGVVQFFPTKPSLQDVTDPYFRGYDMKYPDYWRYKAWEREFDQFAKNGRLPNLSLVRLPHDHFGDYANAIDGVNTVETQMADNDYAVGLLVEKVANSRYRDNTLIFIIEDDAQNGADHVDAHRSIAYVIGPYVKQRSLVSEHYTTVSMLRTIEDVLGMEPMGLNDGLAEPMAEIFDPRQREWKYRAIVPETLYTTQLPLPPRRNGAAISAAAQPKRDAAYWEKAMGGQNFTVEDNLDEPRFNRALWSGLKGEDAPFPTIRHGRDMRDNREKLLSQHQATAQIAGQ
jgi:DNA-binding beta-propeller fold protein YncE